MFRFWICIDLFGVVWLNFKLHRVNNSVWLGLDHIGWTICDLVVVLSHHISEFHDELHMHWLDKGFANCLDSLSLTWACSMQVHSQGLLVSKDNTCALYHGSTTPPNFYRAKGWITGDLHAHSIFLSFHLCYMHICKHVFISYNCFLQLHSSSSTLGNDSDINMDRGGFGRRKDGTNCGIVLKSIIHTSSLMWVFRIHFRWCDGRRPTKSLCRASICRLRNALACSQWS